MAYQNFFVTKLYTDIGASDTTITFETPPTALSGRLTLEARNPTQKEIIKYTGVSGNQITGVLRGQGGTTAKPHTKNALVEMNATGEDLQDILDAFNAFAATNGSGWYNQLTLPTSTVYNGNGSYTHTYPLSIAGLKSPGYRNRYVRAITANTHMGGLLNGTNHYFTKVTPAGALGTITTDFAILATFELPAYAQGCLSARADNTTSNGIFLYFNATGQIICQISNGGSGNAKTATTINSVPLNKKMTVWAAYNAGSFLIYFNGVLQNITVTGLGTNPNVAGTGGDFSIGRFGANASGYFNGYISNVAWFNTSSITQATVRSYQSQPLTGAEPNCIGAWSLNNTLVNQQAPGTNDLSAINGAGFTARTPFTQPIGNTTNVSGTTSYSITHSISADGLTEVVQCAEGDTIPTTGGITTMQYSPHKSPYGFPTDKTKWTLVVHNRNRIQSAATNDVWYNLGGFGMLLPVGSWTMKYLTNSTTTSTNPVGYLGSKITISTSATGESWNGVIPMMFYTAVQSSLTQPPNMTSGNFADITVATVTPIYVLNQVSSSSGGAQVYNDKTELYAENAYL